eukprot:COSAG02_NODE_144_length_34086_cov_65.390944_19_plen_66_part_00
MEEHVRLRSTVVVRAALLVKQYVSTAKQCSAVPVQLPDTLRSTTCYWHYLLLPCQVVPPPAPLQL